MCAGEKSPALFYGVSMVTLNTHIIIVQQHTSGKYFWEMHYHVLGKPLRTDTSLYEIFTEAFQAGTHYMNTEYELGRLPYYEAP